MKLREFLDKFIRDKDLTDMAIMRALREVQYQNLLYLEEFTLGGMNLLHHSIMHRREDLAKFIMKHMADRELYIESQDREGRTPLFFAFEYACSEVVEYLIKNGANKDHKDRYGSDLVEFTLDHISRFANSYSNKISRKEILSIFKKLLHIKGYNKEVQEQIEIWLHDMKKSAEDSTTIHFLDKIYAEYLQQSMNPDPMQLASSTEETLSRDNTGVSLVSHAQELEGRVKVLEREVAGLKEHIRKLSQFITTSQGAKLDTDPASENDSNVATFSSIFN